MSIAMTLTIIVAIANGLLAIAVGSTYVRNHRELRSPMTLALSLFAVFLLVHNGVLVYHLASMMATFTPQAEWFLLAEGTLQLGALLALSYATLR